MLIGLVSSVMMGWAADSGVAIGGGAGYSLLGYQSVGPGFYSGTYVGQLFHPVPQVQFITWLCWFPSLLGTH